MGERRFFLFACPDGEIGRHSGLKIRRPLSGRGGSSPPPGTSKCNAINPLEWFISHRLVPPWQALKPMVVSVAAFGTSLRCVSDILIDRSEQLSQITKHIVWSERICQ
jgi:hypothetical protein